MGLQWASPRVPECGTQADCEGKSTYRFDPAVGVLVIDEQVDIEDEDDDAENNGDDDERKVEINPRGGGVLAALESNRRDGDGESEIRVRDVKFRVQVIADLYRWSEKE
ncbi:hypothetical protein ACFX2I_025369 [Malus domestica]